MTFGGYDIMISYLYSTTVAWSRSEPAPSSTSSKDTDIDLFPGARTTMDPIMLSIVPAGIALNRRDWILLLSCYI